MDLLLEATYRAEREHFWFKGFRAFVAPAIARAAGGRPGLRLLDCGCGTGVNLPLLTAHGTACGIDLTWSGLRFAHDRGRRALAQASVLQLPVAPASIDVLTCFDVLQCFAPARGREVLQEFHRALAPDGRLVMTVAALDVLWGDHSILAEEVHRYGRAELRRTLEAAGFEVERITFPNCTLFPLMAGVRTLQRLRGLRRAEEAHGEITPPWRPVNQLLAALLRAEAWLVRRVNMPVGSSLLVVARKT
jgi:SAM-dependent methyltransferase